jgi:hypothetical protein
MEASSRARHGQGWAVFAAALFMVLGTFNVIDGTVALAGDDHFAESQLFFGDLTFWGLAMVFIGAIQLVTSFLLYRRNPMGQVVGILLVSVNLIAQLFFLPAFPIWSIIIMAGNALALYGLTVYADEYA